ncbi:MAG: hypothetical protein WAN65_25860 [Candidatus Sulfotelmatobacter sp.]
MAFSPDGGSVAVAGGSDLSVWEANGTESRLLRSGTSATRADYNRQGTVLAIKPYVGVYHALKDSVTLIDSHTGEERALITVSAEIKAFIFNPAGNQIAVGATDGSTTLFDLFGREQWRMRERAGVEEVIFSHDGGEVATIAGTRSLNDSFNPQARECCYVQVLDAVSGQVVRQHKYEEDVKNIAFSPDDAYLAAASSDQVTLWHRGASGEIQFAPGKGVNKVLFTPDGRYLCTVTESESGHRVDFWEQWASGNRNSRFHMDADSSVGPIAFNSNGRLVALGVGESALVYTVPDGRQILKAKLDGTVIEAIISTDSAYLLTGSLDGTIRVWSLKTGMEIARMKHAGPVSSVSLSPDGREVASTSEDRTVRLWSWRPEDLIADACSRITRNLSPEEWQLYLAGEPYKKTCSNVP